VLSPWNSGSGFGAKDKEPLRALEAILAHPSPRLAPLREVIPIEVRDAPSRAAAGRIARLIRAMRWIRCAIDPRIDRIA
jgi:CRISPR-associated protein Csx17